ncbi:MAG: hypothetical protein MUC97_09085 [Bernardetiaceae bacterium]|nr:hypothetical protein [Bernardetiaceae bacterium]
MLEIAAMQYGDAFARSVRSLRADEVTIAFEVFQRAIHTDQVRVVETTIIAAPTTLGNNIRIPPGYRMAPHVLVHELTHIWQFQTQGNAYISDSAFHQTVATVASGSRNAAYEYTLRPGASFYDYSAEQQAHIVEDYYLDLNQERRNPEYQRLMDQVRSARPRLTNLDRYQESLYGAGYNNPRTPPLPNPPPGGQTVPIFRIEF